MSRAAEVVVIGGGVVGASTAFHLTKAGVTNVTLLERRYLGAGASGKSGALVRMHYTNPHDGALAAQSLPYFLHWNDMVGAGDPGYVKNGVFWLAGEADAEKLRQNVEMLRSVGAPISAITPDEVRAIDPGLRVDDVAVASWEPDSGYADPSGTTIGFAKAAENHGATILTNTEAIEILTEGDRIVGVSTNDGTIATDTVLVAAGAWAPNLLMPLDLDFRLVPTRVQIVIFRRPDLAPGLHPVIIDGKQAMWIRPEGPYGTLAGLGIDEHQVDPDHYAEGVEQSYLETVRQRLIERRPAMVDAPMRGGWAGVITMSPDGHAILDQTPQIPGLYVAVGDSGTNFKTAPAIGKCLAEWIVDGKATSVDLQPFRGSRFAEGKPLHGEHEYGDSHEGADVFR